MKRLLLSFTHLLIGGLLVFATAEAGVTFEKTNGIYTAKPGVMCTTREAYATLFMSDLDRARGMIGSSDNEAIKKFIAEKRMIYTKAGVDVYIEERLESNIKVRPKGETASLWMPAYGVDCAEAPKPVTKTPVKR